MHEHVLTPPPEYLDEIDARIARTPQVDPDGDARQTDDQSSETSQLVTAARAGDTHALIALVERFSGLVWTMIREHGLNSADAAVVYQAVWLKLVENLGQIREPGLVAGWLVAVTTHGLADDTDAALLTDERSHALSQALERLPTECRLLMSLLQIEPPLSYAEVAAALDVPIGSIGPRRQRCLERLRFYFEDELKLVISRKV